MLKLVVLSFAYICRMNVAFESRYDSNSFFPSNTYVTPSPSAR